MKLFLLAMLVANLVLAQSSVALSEYLPLLNAGATGVFLFGFYKEWWVTGSVYRRMEETTKECRLTIKEKDEEIARLNSYFQSEVIPAIIRFTDIQLRRLEDKLK